MKKMNILAAACCLALALAACNKPLGEEYKTYPVVGTTTFSPQLVTPTDSVTVTATVTSQYGFGMVYIAYLLDDEDISQTKAAGIKSYAKDIFSVDYSRKLPPQPAGTKVRFAVCARSYYSLYTEGQLMEYTVTDGAEITPTPIPDPTE